MQEYRLDPDGTFGGFVLFWKNFRGDWEEIAHPGSPEMAKKLARSHENGIEGRKEYERRLAMRKKEKRVVLPPIQQKLFNPALKVGDRIQEGKRKGKIKAFHSKGTVDVLFDDMDYVIRRQLGSVRRINPRRRNGKAPYQEKTQKFLIQYRREYPHLNSLLEKIPVYFFDGEPQGRHPEASQISYPSRPRHGERSENIIALYPKFWKLPLTTRKYVLTHEIGHFISREVGWHDLSKKLKIDVWDAENLPFGQFNMEEAWADAFATYIHDPADLRKRYPQWFKLVDMSVHSLLTPLPPQICMLRSRDGSDPLSNPRRRNKGKETQLEDIWYDWMMQGKKPANRRGYMSTSELEPFREYKRAQLRNSPRTKYYRELKKDIERHGMDEPVVLILGRDGHAYIGEGNHRHEIAKDLRIEFMPVEFVFWQKASSKGGTDWSRWYKEDPSPSKDDLIDEILADLRLNPKGKKYPTPHGGRYNMDLNRYEMKMSEKGDKVLLRYMDSARQTSIPLQSISQFVQDMTADFSEMNLAQIPHIDAIIKGKAKFLGKGMDGMVFKSLGDTVKVSTTVPFHPDQQTHRTPEQARRHTKKEFDLHRRLAHIPCILPVEYVEWADRAWMIKPYLDLRDDKNITEKEFEMLERCIEAIHAEGVAVGDMLQYGRGKDGQIYLLDLGQSRTPTKWDYKDDISALQRVADKRGFSFKSKTVSVNQWKEEKQYVEQILLLFEDFKAPEDEPSEMDIKDFLKFRQAFGDAQPYLTKAQNKESIDLYMGKLSPLISAHKKKQTRNKNPTTKEQNLIRKIQRVIETRPQLLKEPYRTRVKQGAHPHTGHCYVASQALYSLLGAKGGGYSPLCMQHEGGSHWAILREKDGAILDPTVAQFKTTPDYSKGVRKGYCHPKQKDKSGCFLPDARTRKLLGWMK
jgi:hypothetical protein